MSLDKNTPNTQSVKEHSDPKPISDEKLTDISGGIQGYIVGQANPWDGTEGVPQQPLDKKITTKG